MTDNEIIKALKRCSINRTCIDCPLDEYEGEESCVVNVKKAALDLINRKDAEIERLQKAGEEAVSCFNRMESLYKIKCVEIDEMRRRKNATIERLKNKLFLALHTDTAKRNIESEAIKEFAERLKKEALKHKIFPLDSCVDIDDIDNLVKEMTE